MNVVVWDKNMDNLQKTRDEVLKHMKKGFAFVQQRVDVSSKRQVRQRLLSEPQIETAHRELSQALRDSGVSPVSIIVNNAGRLYGARAEQASSTVSRFWK